MTGHFDADAARERIQRALAERPTEPETTDATSEVTDLDDLGARMHGHRYNGDPLAEITDRMFRR